MISKGHYLHSQNQSVIKGMTLGLFIMSLGVTDCLPRIWQIVEVIPNITFQKAARKRKRRARTSARVTNLMRKISHPSLVAARRNPRRRRQTQPSPQCCRACPLHILQTYWTCLLTLMSQLTASVTRCPMERWLLATKWMYVSYCIFLCCFAIFYIISVIFMIIWYG